MHGIRLYVGEAQILGISSKTSIVKSLHGDILTYFQCVLVSDRCDGVVYDTFAREDTSILWLYCNHITIPNACRNYCHYSWLKVEAIVGWMFGVSSLKCWSIFHLFWIFTNTNHKACDHTFLLYEQCDKKLYILKNNDAVPFRTYWFARQSYLCMSK